MKKLFPIFLLLPPFFSPAQSINWAISGGGWIDDNAKAIKVDTSGNVIVCGFANESNFMPGVSLNQAGVYVLKLDPEGDVLWHYSFGGTAQLTVNDMEVDQAGNIYITGHHYYGVIGVGLNIPGGTPSDIGTKTYLIKLNKNGVVGWYNSYRNNDVPGVNQSGSFLVGGLSVDAEGRLYLSAVFNRPITIGGELHVPNGNDPFFNETYIVIKLDGNGDEEWVVTGGSLASNTLHDLAADEKGVYLLGSTFSTVFTFGTQTFTFQGISNTRQTFVASFDTSGVARWLTPIPRNYSTTGQSLAVDGNGAIVGLVQSMQIITIPDSVLNHNAVFKLTPDGGIYFVRDLDTEEEVHNSLYDVYAPSKIATDGVNIYVTDGFKESFELGPVSFSAPNKEAGVLKINEIGYPQWLKTFTGSNHDFGRAVAASNGGIYVAGEFKSLVLDTESDSLQNNSGNLRTDAIIAGLVDTTANVCPDFSAPAVQFNGEMLICPDETVELFIEAEYACTFDWYRNDSLIYSGVSNSIQASEAGHYHARINQETACPFESDSLLIDLIANGANNPEVLILPVYPVDLGQDTTLCNANEFTISPAPLPNGSYFWNTGASSSTIQVYESGEYWVEYENLWGCADRDTVLITFLPPPQVELGSIIILDSYESIILDPGGQPAGSVFQWGDGSSDPILVVNESMLGEGENLFSVTVTNEFGCTASDTVIICICSKALGIPFIDANNNGEKDPDEPIYLDAQLSLLPAATSVGGSPGEGFIFYAPFGEYAMVFHQNSQWEITTGLDTVPVSLNAGAPFDTVYFGLTPLDTIHQTITGIFAPATRCNEPVTIDVVVKNIGTVISGGTLWLEADPLLEGPVFVDVPDTIAGPNLYGWHFENLYPGYSNTYQISFSVPGIPAVNLGDSLSLVSFVSYNDSLVSPAFAYSSVINCAYDPNDKLVYPNRPGNYTAFGESLLYTIRFQNTGNDYAQNVLIRDTLDTNLDPATFLFVASSHVDELTIVRENGYFLSFYFNNIFLPDSTSNFEESQGYVSFLIDPVGGLAEGTEIENSASIYMDFNPPIHTNSVENILVNEIPTCEIWSLGISTLECDDNLTPSNPTDDLILFSLNPSGFGLWGEYSLNSSGNPVSPGAALFGGPAFFSIPAGSGSTVLNLAGVLDGTCPLEFVIEDIGFCSPLCEITGVGLAEEALCNDNGTPGDPTDDFIEFQLNPAGFNLGDVYGFEITNGFVLPPTAPYGDSTSFSLQPGSAGAGDWVISVWDQLNSECSLEFLLIDPGACSVNAVHFPRIQNGLDIYPSLTDGLVKISMKQNHSGLPGQLQIRDINGRILYRDRFMDFATPDLAGLPAQLLLVEVIVGNHLYTGRILLY